MVIIKNQYLFHHICLDNMCSSFPKANQGLLSKLNQITIFQQCQSLNQVLEKALWQAGFHIRLLFGSV